MTNKNSDLETIWAIRDSRGFNANEKAFLLIVASRGTMSSKWQRASADMGMSRDTYYRTREKLIAKKAIKVLRRMDDTTLYEVNVEALADTQDANDHTQVAYSDTQDANENTQVAEPKRTQKITKKTTVKTTTDTDGAVAPVDGKGPISPPKTEKTTEVPLPPIPSNNRDGAEGAVTTTTDPDTQVAYTATDPAMFGLSAAERESKRKRDEAAARIGGDW